MANLRLEFKKKTTGFGNIEERRILRAFEEVESRRKRRSAIHANNRQIPESTRSPVSSLLEETKQNKNQRAPNNVQTEDRRTRLLKWKAERELQKNLQRQLKQPVFRAGVCHHKLNSPIFLHQSLPATKPQKLTPRITRATAKRLAAKKNDTQTLKIPSAQSLKNSKNYSSKIKVLESSFAPQNYKFKPPEGLPNLPLFGREALDEAKTEAGIIPVYFSPYVVSSRGKRAMRIEQLHNIQAGDHTSRKTQNELKPDSKEIESSIGEEGPTPSYFRAITEKEVDRLRALCQQWMILQSDVNVPEDAQLLINQAIGQTNLFIDKKIEQFKSLITDCETGSGTKLVTCQDLQGFWDMMFMQVKDCDARFIKLIVLRENNWQEEQQETVKKPTAKKSAPAKKVVASNSSSVRDMIRAARRKQMESLKAQNPSSDIHLKSPSDTSKLSVKFDGGFFMVESPRKAVTPRSVKKSTLLVQQKSSADTKHRRSALSAIKVSQLLKPLTIKPVEIESDPTIPYVNSQQTPGKSILKRADANDSMSCTKKSHNKVNFSHKKDKILSHNVSWLSDPNNVMLDDDEITTEPRMALDVIKRLNFASADSSDEDCCNEEDSSLEKDVVQKGQDVQKTLALTETLEHKKDQLSPSLVAKKKSVDDAGVSSRTRKAVLNERNQPKILELSNTEAKESGTPRVEAKSSTKELEKENEKPSSPQVTRRRSSRKSVRFTGEECTVCSLVKPVHPMTPHVKRRTSKLLEAKSTNEISIDTTAGTLSSEIVGDLIFCNTPKEDPPARVRRSLRLQNTKP